MFLAYDRHSITSNVKLDILVEVKENNDYADVAAFCCAHWMWKIVVVHVVVSSISLLGERDGWFLARRSSGMCSWMRWHNFGLSLMYLLLEVLFLE